MNKKLRFRFSKLGIRKSQVKNDLQKLLIQLQSLKIGVSEFAWASSQFQRLRSSLVETNVPRLLTLVNLLLHRRRRINRFRSQTRILDESVVNFVQSFQLVIPSKAERKWFIGTESLFWFPQLRLEALSSMWIISFN